MENHSFAYDAFLNYASADLQAASELARRLARDGLRVWFDKEQIHPKVDSRVAKALFEDGLKKSRALVMCVSSSIGALEWTDFEAKTFRFRDSTNIDRRFIPVRLDEVTLPAWLVAVKCVDWLDRGMDGYQQIRDACNLPSPASSRTQEAVRRQTVERTIRHPVSGVTARIYTVGENVWFLANFAGEIWSGRIDQVSAAVKLGVECGRISALLPLDRERLVIACHDGKMRVLTTSGQEELAFEGHAGRATCLAVAESDVIVTGGVDNAVRRWSLTSGERLAEHRGHTGQINSIAAQGSLIVSGSNDSTVRIWDTGGKRGRVLEGHTGSVCSVALSDDGKIAFTGSYDCTIRLWDTSSGFCKRILQGHTDAVTAIALHSNQRHLLTGAGDRTIRLWDTITGQCLRVMDGHRGDVLMVKWTSDSQAISAGPFDRYVWTLKGIDFSLTTTGEEGDSGRSGDPEQQVQYTNAKVLLVGESGAGKSSLSIRLATNEWDPGTDSTLGAWAKQWKLPLQQEKDTEREIWLWDFGGQSDQRIIHQLYMADAALAVLIFNGQKDDLFESIGQWDRGVSRASPGGLSKLLVAARIDAGGLKYSRRQIDQFVAERGFNAYIETSAKNGDGCDRLRQVIVESIAWQQIPWRSSPLMFKRLKDHIVRIKEAGYVLMRFNELRDRLKLEMSPDERNFSDDQLKAVLSLLAGPGVVTELQFGGWILLKPELINAYAQALVQTVRNHPDELGCIEEERVLAGDLHYSMRPEVTPQDEKFILFEMHKQLIERGLCIRQQTDKGPLLILPSFYRRQRPAVEEYPSIIVTYEFDGYSDEVHAVLVVHLIHTHHFEQDELWKDAADFKTKTGKRIGIRFSALGEGKGKIEVYAAPGSGDGQIIQFLGYVHELLKQRTVNVVRKRHYVCPHCGEPVNDHRAVAKKLASAIHTIVCQNCEERVPLWDELEEIYQSKGIVEKVRELEERVGVVLDNESKERVLVGEVMSRVALAGHIAREKNADHGIDMEIEFKDSAGRATGNLIYLQLKSGDSYLEQRKTDGAQIFRIQNQRHVQYWLNHRYPVFLVIRRSSGEIQWMDIQRYLRDETENGRKKVSHIVFNAEIFDAQSIHKFKEALSSSK